jgi:hypothetical protein
MAGVPLLGNVQALVSKAGSVDMAFARCRGGLPVVLLSGQQAAWHAFQEAISSTKCIRRSSGSDFALLGNL